MENVTVWHGEGQIIAHLSRYCKAYLLTIEDRAQISIEMELDTENWEFTLPEFGCLVLCPECRDRHKLELEG